MHKRNKEQLVLLYISIMHAFNSIHSFFRLDLFYNEQI